MHKQVKGQNYWPSELYFGGIVMSDAEAHPMNGDTAVTLFIGGQITLRNGAYPMRAGDVVQWYLDDEAEAGVFDEVSAAFLKATQTLLDHSVLMPRFR